MIHELPFLEKTECERAREGVFALREHWLLRSGSELPFYTMGVTAWTANSPGNPYHDLKQSHNALLRERLDWLYERLLATLSSHLEEPATTNDKTALPAFQIHLWPAKLMDVHVDLHHLGLRWDSTDQVDATKFFSFVIPIALPRAGGGLDFWEMAVDEFDRLSPIEQKVVLEMDRREICYDLGRIYLHWGKMLHRPSRRRLGKKEARVVIQGHGIRVGSAWHIYG